MLTRSNRPRYSIPGGFVAAVFAICCGSASYGQWEMSHKLTAEDAAANNCFGFSVSICGNAIVVGAIDYFQHDTNGYAYVFDAGTGQQLHKLAADDGAEGDQFGCSVSICGNRVVVGAYRDDDGGGSSGSAYVFDAGTGGQLHKLTAEDAEPGDQFGFSVAVDGDRIVVGANEADEIGDDSGAAYLFDANTGQQIYKLIPFDPDSGAMFGSSVAIEGDMIVIGAPQDDNEGAVYLFDAGTGEQIEKLTAIGASNGDLFGHAASISGQMIVVGAIGRDGAEDDTGSVFVFDAETGDQLHEILADDGHGEDYFGTSVSISGDTIIVGAYFDDDAGADSGSAYLFDAVSAEQIQKLAAQDGTSGDLFGCYVALSGSRAVVGAFCDDDAGGCSGSAYVFDGPAQCSEDVNGDETVDIDDIFGVLGAWGPCDQCPEDTNDDGEVNIDDIFAVLGAWGPCP